MPRDECAPYIALSENSLAKVDSFEIEVSSGLRANGMISSEPNDGHISQTRVKQPFALPDIRVIALTMLLAASTSHGIVIPGTYNQHQKWWKHQPPRHW